LLELRKNVSRRDAFGFDMAPDLPEELKGKKNYYTNRNAKTYINFTLSDILVLANSLVIMNPNE
jgi:hypothetical protein